MSDSTGDEARKINVLVLGESPNLFSLFHPLSLFRPLAKVRCQWHFAKSRQEMSKILDHTKLDIVLSIYTHQRLSEMMALLTGLRVSMFHMLPVEEGCWWLPVLRNAENCLGAPALRPNEFSYVLTEIVENIITDVASSGPSVV
jgi:hypothetical protein